MSLSVFTSAAPAQEGVFLRRLFGEKQAMKRPERLPLLLQIIGQLIGRRINGIDRPGVFDLTALVGRA